MWRPHQSRHRDHAMTVEAQDRLNSHSTPPSSPGSAQRFLSMHMATYNVLTIPRHLVSARTHHLFRAKAFEAWRSAADITA